MEMQSSLAESLLSRYPVVTRSPAATSSPQDSHTSSTDPLLEGSSLHGGEIALATKHRHNSSFDMNAMELDEIDTQPLRLFGAFMGLYSAPYTWWDILRMSVLGCVLFSWVVWIVFPFTNFHIKSQYVFTEVTLFGLLYCSTVTNMIFGAMYFRSDHLRVLIGRITALPFFSPKFQRRCMCWEKRIRHLKLVAVSLFVIGFCTQVTLVFFTHAITNLPISDFVRSLFWIQVALSTTWFIGQPVVVCCSIAMGIYLQRLGIRQLAHFFHKANPENFCLNESIRYYNQVFEVLQSVPTSMVLFLACFCGLSALSALIFLKGAFSAQITKTALIYSSPSFFFLLLSFSTLYQMGLVDSEYSKLLECLNESLASRAGSCTNSSGEVLDPKEFKTFITYWQGLSTFIEKKPLQFVIFGQRITSALVVRIMYIVASALVLIVQSLAS